MKLSPTNESLVQLMKTALGYDSFRPYQEEVCRAAIAGRDALLVMPTGAGKSLCYQLPGLALKGTTLVISPLVALMEDQVAKMKARGLRAERIHAGRERADSRQVCFDYLDGKLDFLYVAPERLGVPNFPQMLAKRKPVLIAVDEAHCISQWGHDFRPDYRRLKERLAPLRPAPIMAVTATATRQVQDDIVLQLELTSAERFIHGFRRSNIAIELVEMAPSLREEKVLELLSRAEMRPAIVYTPTRKSSTSLGELLKTKMSAEAYHAGLKGADRDRIQKAFLDGNMDVIVATIAFGMGIDKANVRTVIHTALPGSVEGYYQEIGRAGRDGKMSRAVLMHSYSDRRTHEFFFDRDYPEAATLQKIYDATSETPVPKDVLMENLALDPETFERSLEKLWIHQGVEVDFAENIKRGKATWAATYELQKKHKAFQLDQVSDYVKSRACRMGHLVRHFGDDEGGPCELCDHCAPGNCVSREFRALEGSETEGLYAIYTALADRDGQSVGRIHQKVAETVPLDRTQFEEILDGLSRADYLRLETDTFDKDGKVISFQRAYLTAKARTQRGFLATEISISPSFGKKSKKKKSAPAKRNAEAASNSALSPEDLDVFKKLRDWRLAEARSFNVPAFCILSDRVMRSIATARPASEDELLAIHGFGQKLLEKHGARILQVLGE